VVSGPAEQALVMRLFVTNKKAEAL